MDYPVTDPKVGLHNGKFTDGSADGSVKPSLDTAAWSNAVTDSILAVQAWTGEAANETDTTQLARGINGKITAMATSINNQLAPLATNLGLAPSSDNFATLATAQAQGRFLNIAGLSSATAADDDDLLAIFDQGTAANRKVSISTLFVGRSGIDQTARDQLALTNMRLMLNSAVSTGALVGGKQWEFLSDEWGSSSASAMYVAGSPGYYTNLADNLSPIQATDFTGATSNVVVSNGTVSADDSNTAIRSIAASSGNFAVTFTYNGRGALQDWFVCLLPASQVGTFNSSDSSGGIPGAPSYSTTFNSGGVNVMYSSTVLTSMAVAVGDVFKFARMGSIVTLSKNGAVVWTYSQTTSENLYTAIGHQNGSGLPALTNFKSGPIATAATNMTLSPPSTFTVSVPLATSPTHASLYCLWKDDSASANPEVDLAGWIGVGTRWLSTVMSYPLGSTFVDGTYNIIKWRASLAGSGYAPGVSLSCGINALNNKAQRVAAPALYLE